MRKCYVVYKAFDIDVLIPFCRKLIQDEGLRKQQIKSAETVIRLLSPPINSIAQDDFGNTSQPSMIAASTILHYARSH